MLIVEKNIEDAKQIINQQLQKIDNCFNTKLQLGAAVPTANLVSLLNEPQIDDGTMDMDAKRMELAKFIAKAPKDVGAFSSIINLYRYD